jgi:hypothetical protein
MTEGAVTLQDVGPALERCRKDIAEFKRLRLITEAAMNGIIPCKATPEQLAALVQRYRDPLKERMAAEQHRDFLRMLYKREPTAEELRAGPPTLLALQTRLVEEGIAPGTSEDAMGLIPLLPLVAVVGGAFGLSNLFSFMAGGERTAHREAGIAESAAGTARNWWDTAKTWALPGALAVGVGGLLYFWVSRKYDLKKARASRAQVTVQAPEPKALPEPKAEMKSNYAAEDEDEDEKEQLEVEEEQLEDEEE